MKLFYGATLLFSLSLNLLWGVNLDINYSAESKVTEIAVAKLLKTLDKLAPEAIAEGKWGMDLINVELETAKLKGLKLPVESLGPEAFQILKQEKTVYIIGGDERGLMYGILDLREQLEMGYSLGRVKEKTERARFPFRAIKFNLPWSSYRLRRILAASHGNSQGY